MGRRARWFSRSRVAAAALVTLSCSVAVWAIASPASALQPDAVPATTSLSLSASPAVVDYGGTATLSGELSCAGGPVATAALELSSSADGTSWSQLTMLTTDQAGRFAATVTPDESRSTTSYRISFAGDTALAPAEAEVSVVVRVALAVPSVPLSVGLGSGFTASGTLQPLQVAGDAAPVSLACYRLEGGLWVLRETFGAGITSTAGGSGYAALLTLPAPGSWRLRAVAAQSTQLESWSPWSDVVTVGATPDAPIWNRDGVLSLPERMANRSDARQLVVVTGSSLGARTGTLRLYDYSRGDWIEKLSAPARFGFRGLTDGLRRHAGSLTTPTGIWRLPGFVFGTHARPPSGAHMTYRRITSHSWWSAVRGATYNTWVESRKAIDGEHLADYRSDYEFAFSSGYNARPNQSVYGRGTAIFVHVFPHAYTAGCVAVSRATMMRLVRALDPASRPACAVGTTRRGTRTWIRAY